MSQNSLNEDHLTAWRLFITTHARLIDQIDKELNAAHCIPLHWYDVLIELVETPEHRLRLHELAEKVVLSRSGLTRLLDRLEKAGYLHREPDPTDRRGAFAVLNEAGRNAIREAWPVYAAAIQQYFAHYLNPEEAVLLTTMFSRMSDA